MRNRMILWPAATAALTLLSASFVIARHQLQLIKPVDLSNVSHTAPKPIDPAALTAAANKSGVRQLLVLPPTAPKPVTLNAGTPYDPATHHALSGSNLMQWQPEFSWIELGQGLLFIVPGHHFAAQPNWQVNISVTGTGSAILQWTDANHKVITDTINVTGPTQLLVALPFGSYIVASQPAHSDILIDNIVIQPM